MPKLKAEPEAAHPWGQRLRKLMHDRGRMSAPELARRMYPDDEREQRAARERIYGWRQGRVDQPRGDEIARLAHALGVTIDQLKPPKTLPGGVVAPDLQQINFGNEKMADGTKVEAGQLTPEQLRHFNVATTGRKAGVWRLTSDVLLGAHYRPGQLLIVDLEAQPADRDVVLALYDGVVALGVYFHPYLFSLRLTENPPALMIDNKRTIVKGVVKRTL